MMPKQLGSMVRLDLICMANASLTTLASWISSEGPVFKESYEYLEKENIKVKRCILQEEGAQVLNDYAKKGVIYNS